MGGGVSAARYCWWARSVSARQRAAVDRLQPGGGGGERAHAGVDRQVRRVDEADLLGAGVDVDQRLARLGHVDQRVAAARGLAEAGADQQQKVGVADPVAERRGDRDADVAGIAAVRVVEVVLAAERDADRQIEGLGERPDVGAGLGVPAAAAEDRERPPGGGEQHLQARHVLGRGMGLRPAGSGRHRAQSAGSVSMSSGSASTTGPGRPEVAVWKARATSSGQARRVVDLGHPLGDVAEHLAVVDLLERLAAAHRARDLADQQDHRRRVLARDVDAVAGVGGAGAARHHRDAGAPGELAVGLGHHRGAAFLAAGDVADLAVVQRVEQREVALAGHAERELGAVDPQLVDQDLAAGAKIALLGHRVSSSIGPGKKSSCRICSAV